MSETIEMPIPSPSAPTSFKSKIPTIMSSLVHEPATKWFLFLKFFDPNSNTAYDRSFPNGGKVPDPTKEQKDWKPEKKVEGWNDVFQLVRDYVALYGHYPISVLDCCVGYRGVNFEKPMPDMAAKLQVMQEWGIKDEPHPLQTVPQLAAGQQQQMTPQMQAMLANANLTPQINPFQEAAMSRLPQPEMARTPQAADLQSMAGNPEAQKLMAQLQAQQMAAMAQQVQTMGVQPTG